MTPAKREHIFPLILRYRRNERGHGVSLNFCVYMLECKDGSLYVGHTDNLETRLAAHQQGTFKGYTSKRRPVRLIFCERFNTRDDTFAAERRIKGWSRVKKLALARGDWAEVTRLARLGEPHL